MENKLICGVQNAGTLYLSAAKIFSSCMFETGSTVYWICLQQRHDLPRAGLKLKIIISIGKCSTCKRATTLKGLKGRGFVCTYFFSAYAKILFFGSNAIRRVILRIECVRYFSNSQFTMYCKLSRGVVKYEKVLKILKKNKKPTDSMHTFAAYEL